jgi:hypothetical protein
LRTRCAVRARATGRRWDRRARGAVADGREAVPLRARMF